MKYTVETLTYPLLGLSIAYVTCGDVTVRATAGNEAAAIRRAFRMARRAERLRRKAGL